MFHQTLDTMAANLRAAERQQRSGDGNGGPANNNNNNNSNNNNISTEYNDDGGPWDEAIHTATTYSFGSPANHRRVLGSVDNNSAGRRQRDEEAALSPVEVDFRRVDRSLVYLDELRRLLEQQESREWVPRPCHPPPFDPDGQNEQAVAKKEKKEKKKKKKQTVPILRRRNIGTFKSSESDGSDDSSKDKKPPANPNPPPTGPGRGVRRSLSSNRYATIAYDSDEESEDFSSLSSDNGNNRNNPEVHRVNSRAADLSADALPYLPSLSSIGDDDDDDDGGGNPPAENQQRPGTQFMDTHRLLIRLHSSRSDLHAKKARLLAGQHRWLEGAGALQTSIVDLATSIELADQALSVMVAHGTWYVNNTQPSQGTYYKQYFVPETEAEDFVDRRRTQLEQDAGIASVSIQYLMDEKERYLKAARKQVAKLEKILKPLWKSRERAKKRIGHDKWKANPKPLAEQSHLARARRKHEEELCALEEALDQLQIGEKNTTALVNEAAELKEKLQQMDYTKNRYNGRRPNQPQAAEVDPESGHPDPDPEQWGWTFTGSVDRDNGVRFYERWIDLGPPPPPPLITGLSGPLLYSGYDAATPPSESVRNNYQSPGPFIWCKLDVHSVTGAVRSVIEYPAIPSSDGSLVHQPWVSTLKLQKKYVADNNNNNNSSSSGNNNDEGNVEDDSSGSSGTVYDLNFIVWTQILTDPMGVHRHYGGTNVAVLTAS